MTSIFLKLIFPGFMFVWSLYHFELASYIYVSLGIILSLYLFTIDKLKPKPDSNIYTYNEIELIRRYHLFLKYPFASKNMSVLLNIFRMSAVIWTPWLYWNHSWILGSIILVIFIFFGGLAVRLDPLYFLNDAVNRGKYQFEEELDNLKILYNKLWNIEISKEQSA